MCKTIIISCFMFCFMSLMAQDTSVMIIKTAGIEVGQIEFINFKPFVNKEHYKVHSNTRFFGFYQVEYMLEAWYTHEILDSSIAYYKINGKTKHHCQIYNRNSLFHVSRYECETITHPIPLMESYCRIFFKKNYPPTSIYSEYDGNIKHINYVNDSTFQIMNINKIEASYILRDSLVIRGYINHALLRFKVTIK